MMRQNPAMVLAGCAYQAPGRLKGAVGREAVQLLPDSGSGFVDQVNCYWWALEAAASRFQTRPVPAGNAKVGHQSDSVQLVVATAIARGTSGPLMLSPAWRPRVGGCNGASVLDQAIIRNLPWAAIDDQAFVWW
jgi:hypothetical protein